MHEPDYHCVRRILPLVRARDRSVDGRVPAAAITVRDLEAIWREVLAFPSKQEIM
jgi:hypothetical protein